MSIVKPVELTTGLARNQARIRRVRMLECTHQGRHDCAQLHLVVDAGMSGTSCIEAWRGQARRLNQVARNGKLLNLTNLTVKAMGEKAQWQCADSELYGNVIAAARLEEGQ